MVLVEVQADIQVQVVLVLVHIIRCTIGEFDIQLLHLIVIGHIMQVIVNVLMYGVVLLKIIVGNLLIQMIQIQKQIGDQ